MCEGGNQRPSHLNQRPILGSYWNKNTENNYNNMTSGPLESIRTSTQKKSIKYHFKTVSCLCGCSLRKPPLIGHLCSCYGHCQSGYPTSVITSDMKIFAFGMGLHRLWKKFEGDVSERLDQSLAGEISKDRSNSGLIRWWVIWKPRDCIHIRPVTCL